MSDNFFICSAASELIDSEAAEAECNELLSQKLGGRKPDLLFVFASPHHRDAYAFIQESLLEDLKPEHLLGCSGGGIIGGARELEETPGLSVTAMVLPGVDISLMRLRDDDLPGLDDSPKAWEQVLGVTAEARPYFITLVSPFMERAQDLLAGLDYAFPQALKIGGVVSGLRHVNERALFHDAERHSDGALVLALSGDIRVDSVVAQGCRPIGALHTITSANGNVINKLDGEPAAEALQEIFEGADVRTRDLMQRALFVGVAGDALNLSDPQPGDFLIRNVMDLDRQNGQLTVAAFLREGMRVRFHVRDAESADQDLKQAMARDLATDPKPTAGGLLFSCLGRGERLFGEPDHDSKAFVEAYKSEALGGFFCSGEIGPVGGETSLHGFTSCYALFRRP